MPKEAKFKVVTLLEMEEVFNNARIANILSLPITADVAETIINTVDRSLENSDSEYEFNSFVYTDDGVSVILKLKPVAVEVG